ncbi:MAG: hypothetical protein ACRDN9_02715 [Streptosporangiaceae bacterium]
MSFGLWEQAATEVAREVDRLAAMISPRLVLLAGEVRARQLIGGHLAQPASEALTEVEESGRGAGDQAVATLSARARRLCGEIAAGEAAAAGEWYAPLRGERDLVVVPDGEGRRTAGFDEVRHFARAAAELIAAKDPDRFTVERRKDQRGNRVFLDYLRNAYAQTSVAPYAARAKPGAPVATPLHWDELEDVEPWRFTTRNLFRRLDSTGDPWSTIARRARSLAGPAARLRRDQNQSG